MKVERATMRFSIVIGMLLYTVNSMVTRYASYQNNITNYSEVAERHLRFFYFYIAQMVIWVALFGFFMYAKYTLVKKERYLVIEDGVLYIPSSLTKKVKELKIEDIECISMEGFYEDRFKIIMKDSTKYFISPRIYNVYDIDIKKLYHFINKLLVNDQRDMYE